MHLIAKGLLLFKICFKQVQFWEQKRSYWVGDEED